MKVVVLWNIPDQMRNALLQNLQDFKAAHPGAEFEAFVQNSPIVFVADMLREPMPAVSAGSRSTPPPVPGPQPSPFERATAAIQANPGLRDRAIAKKIGVSHQTVGRARETLKGKPGANRSTGRSVGPRGPRPSGMPR